MKLNRHGREYLTVELVTDPPVTAWEATFDNGATWIAGTRVQSTNDYQWLLAGSQATPGSAVAVLTPGNHSYTVRATAGSEIIARFGGSIYVE